jgi:hypothetical protein
MDFISIVVHGMGYDVVGFPGSQAVAQKSSRDLFNMQYTT